MIALDHVTQFVSNRSEASQRLRDIGFHAVSGGEHVGFGSANDLCYFGLFYLEMLEILDPEVAAASGSEVCRYAVDFLRGGNGLATLAMETDDLEVVTDQLVRHGYRVPEPVQMQRVHDDGFVSHSRIIYPEKQQSPIRPPIVIERTHPPEQRQTNLVETGIIADHPVGHVEVEYVGVAVHDALAAAAELASAYGGDAETGLTPHDPLDGDYVEIRFSRTCLRLYQPHHPNGVVADHLSGRGPGPFVVGISGDGNVAKALQVGENGVSGPEQTGFWWSLSEG